MGEAWNVALCGTRSLHHPRLHRSLHPSLHHVAAPSPPCVPCSARAPAMRSSRVAMPICPRHGAPRRLMTRSPRARLRPRPPCQEESLSKSNAHAHPPASARHARARSTAGPADRAARAAQRGQGAPPVRRVGRVPRLGTTTSCPVPPPSPPPPSTGSSTRVTLSTGPVTRPQPD